MVCKVFTHTIQLKVIFSVHNTRLKNILCISLFFDISGGSQARLIYFVNRNIVATWEHMQLNCGIVCTSFGLCGYLYVLISVLYSSRCYYF